MKPPAPVEAEPPTSTHNALKQTFHVAMLLFGCGSPLLPLSNNLPKPPHSQIGTNLTEVTALRIALSQHKLQTKYFSLDSLNSAARIAPTEEQQLSDENVEEVEESSAAIEFT